MGNDPVNFIDPLGLIPETPGNGKAEEPEVYNWQVELPGMMQNGYSFDEIVNVISNNASDPFEYLSSNQARNLVGQTVMGGGPFYLNPNPGSKVTDDFDPSRDPISTDNGTTMPGHYGVDLSNGGTGTIVAPREGIVIAAGASPSLGNYVDIEHPWGEITRTGHHANTIVSVDDVVKVGQPIATEGSTGFATGPHTHLEIIPYAGAPREENINPATRLIE